MPEGLYTIMELSWIVGRINMFMCRLAITDVMVCTYRILLVSIDGHNLQYVRENNVLLLFVVDNLFTTPVGSQYQPFASQ